MKFKLKRLLSFIFLAAAMQNLNAATKFEASGTSSPSPLNLAGKGTITITPQGDLGEDVYVFSWCGIYAGQTGFSMQWQDAINEKYRMTRNSDGSYTYKLPKTYQEWFKLTDEQCANLKQVGFIARNTSEQTVDVFIDCIFKQEYFSGGIGTATDPYQINNAEDLEYLANNNKFWVEDTYFLQTSNIEIDRLPNPIGNETVPFKGIYNGDGFSINGLRIKCNPGSAAGLFGVASGAVIKNVVLENCVVKGAGYAGTLVGKAENCRISQSLSSQGEVWSSLLGAGGLVGCLEGGDISDCYSSSDVIAPDEKAVGGLVGKNTGEIRSCYATGSLTASNYIGGLAGANYGKIIHSAALNKSIEGSGKFVGRFGGNNNHQNESIDNYAWSDMPYKSHDNWSYFSDHANRPELMPQSQSTYKDGLEWDFGNVWYWKKLGESGFPELRIVKNELPSPMPEEFTTSILNVEEDCMDIESIYSLEGMFMGDSLDKLPRGIYIVKTKNKAYKILH